MAYATTQLAVRVHLRQKRAFDAVVRKTRETRSSHVRRAMDEYLDRYYPEEARAAAEEDARRQAQRA